MDGGHHECPRDRNLSPTDSSRRVHLSIFNVGLERHAASRTHQLRMHEAEAGFPAGSATAQKEDSSLQ